ncbi:MAG: chromosome segregation ATPase, partial [Spirulina sp.]
KRQALLLKMPAVPNCPEIFLPTASASVRLYCAQVAANKQDAENLLYAIQLVEDLPPDHPLRFEIDRLMESWVSEALRWGEEKYQAGELEEALALAREFSLRFHKTTLVEERIAHWQSTWSKGERIEGEIEDLMERSAWGQAFQAAAKLTQLNNRYWATNRYDQWYERLNLARQESRKLDKAFIQLERGGLDNLLGAIALAEDVPRESSAYVESRSLLSEAADALLDLAFQNLQAGNWQGAMEVANSIPAKFNLNEEIIDINNLADAASTAAYGSIVNLEDAINLAREIAPGRPLYSRTQNLIRRWQTEIEGISNLAQADRLAREGSVSALNAAIEQARLIAANNPRYSQARQKITQWQRRIENIKNRSPLEGGIQFTSAESSSNTNSPLSFNSPPRPLPSETRPTPSTGDLPNTRNSTRNSTRDRALLDRAVALAEQGRYAEAMQLSGRIGADSSSYLEAKNYRDRWQGEARSQVVLTRAYKRAAERTPNGLRTAIETARTIPGNSRVGRQSQQAIAAWSAEILSLARGEASRNLPQAIAIAQQVPPIPPPMSLRDRKSRSGKESWQLPQFPI